MSLTINLVLLIAAFICFVLSAAGIPSRVGLQSLGLCFWVLAIILGGVV
jgi:hypothetical protein